MDVTTRSIQSWGPQSPGEEIMYSQAYGCNVLSGYETGLRERRSSNTVKNGGLLRDTGGISTAKCSYLFDEISAGRRLKMHSHLNATY